MTGFDPTLAPRDDAVTPLAPGQVADLLDSSGMAMARELRALGDALAWFRPGPTEWCATEVVGHVIEADRRGFAGRIGRILERDGVEESGWDQLAVAAARRDAERPVADVIAELRSGRDAGIALVRSLRAVDLGRSAVHASVGRVTIADLLQEWVFHDRNHLRQLLLSAQTRVWPAMGDTRRFTRADA
jgi:hypothetical protein